MTTRTRIKGEATAYRLWCAANAMGWDCTIVEAARAAGISNGAAVAVVKRKGWRTRFSGDAVSAAKSRSTRRGNANRFHDETSSLIDVCDMMKWGQS